MLAALGLLFIFAKPTDLTFVRHGETVANATGRYNSKTLNTFSDKGAAGVVALTKRLSAEPKFDLILVSPSLRVLKTIAPYLRATHQKATVWPLLYECCTERRPKDAAPTSFAFGAKIQIPKEMADLFVVEPTHDRLPFSSNYNAGLAQVDASVAEFKQRFEGGRVLVVGHSGQGGHFIHVLTGRWHKLENAQELSFKLP